MTAHLRLVDGVAGSVPRPGDQPLLGAPVRFTAGSRFPDTALAAEDYPAHLARFGERPVATGSAGLTLLDTLARIELTGRGGGHFPVAAKWQSQLDAGAGGVVVANAAESEPASAKDAALILLRPHLVLDGLALAAEAVCAEDAILWLHDDARIAHASLSRALAERRASSSSEPTIRIVTGPHRYLSGESSAIVRALSGGPALPQFRRVPATTSGVGGRPTLIHNVETLARVALAARCGPEQHRASTLFTVTHRRVRTVVEVDPTTHLCQVIETVLAPAGAARPQAVLVGGYGGSWHSWDDVADLPADQKAFRDKGISSGAGVLLPLGPDECGISTTSLIVDYLARNSARQCGPCLFGLRAVADLFAEVAQLAGRRRDVRRLHRFLDEIAGRGGCHHPDGAVRLVSSAIRVFPADLDDHLRRGRCQAGASESPTFEPEFS